LGGITAVLGVLHALMEHDLKRLLAYHTVENIGIIFIGLGLALAFRANEMAVPAALAMTAALFHVFNHSVFKSLLFFGSGAVLNATGERDMEHLGGLIHRMPFTAFAFLIGSAAISALPPFNGALLALSAALAAACFVKAFGITFLGRPRTSVAENARETDVLCLYAMFALVVLCLIAGILPGYFIDALAPVVQMAVGAQLQNQSALSWLTIVPIAQSRSSYNGLVLFILIAVAAYLAIYVIHRWASHAIRRSAPWDCGFPDASAATQYSAGSFAQPIRRVFGSFVFRACEEIHIAPPGDLQPARMHVHLRDLMWDLLYAPVARIVSVSADVLNRVQFLTIRGYLTLVSGALVALLVVLAVWQ
jgi:hydrogenase-4 component B